MGLQAVSGGLYSPGAQTALLCLSVYNQICVKDPYGTEYMGEALSAPTWASMASYFPATTTYSLNCSFPVTWQSLLNADHVQDTWKQGMMKETGV